MSRGLSIVLAAAVLVVTNCARQGEPHGTTTVTSGSTSGVNVTGMRVEKDQVAMRLADEICAREVACNRVGPGRPYRTEEACMAEQGAAAPTQITRWSCVPAQTSAGFEECLAAIRSERCEMPLAGADRLLACRGAQVCGH